MRRINSENRRCYESLNREDREFSCDGNVVDRIASELRSILQLRWLLFTASNIPDLLLARIRTVASLQASALSK